jgi:hypothetical protein
VIVAQYAFWIKEFLASPFSGGVHLVSDSELPSINLSQAIVNQSAGRLATRQARCRCRSLEYFLENTTAEYFLYITHDTYVWPQNLDYLVSEIADHNFTSESNFILGQCMHNRDGTFLHGGSYLHSRTAARLALGQCPKYVPGVQATWRAEDVRFRDVMRAIGIDLHNTSSAYIVGQYALKAHVKPMEDMNMSFIAECPPIITACGECAPEVN